MSTKTLWMLLLGLCLAAGPALADQITIPDTILGSGSNGGSSYNTNNEDQEVEPGMDGTQKWDLEGMFFDKDAKTLTMVGGWNFISFLKDSKNRNIYSGDIFVAYSQGAPYFGATAGSAGAGTMMSDYLYNYVMDVDWTGGTFETYANGQGTPVSLVNESLNAPDSNPVRRSSGGILINDGEFTFASGLTNDQTGFLGGTHYSATFDIAWLINSFYDYDTGFYEVPDIWFHFTMDCGNDLLMGKIPGYRDDAPPPVVPEPATMSLLGIGIAGMITLQMRRKAAKA